jgi:hypothetical protein
VRELGAVLHTIELGRIHREDLVLPELLFRRRTRGADVNIIALLLDHFTLNVSGIRLGIGDRHPDEALFRPSGQWHARIGLLVLHVLVVIALILVLRSTSSRHGGWEILNY